MTDWSMVARDDLRGDWDADGAVPGLVHIKNSACDWHHWDEAATFCRAVADALQAEAEADALQAEAEAEEKRREVALMIKVRNLITLDRYESQVRAIIQTVREHDA